jgi:hypothetical protein
MPRAIASRCSPGPGRTGRERISDGAVSCSASMRGAEGDPSPGGSTRQPLTTAYRQQALACAVRCGQAPAGRILLRNVYGWFERTQPGMYRLTKLGEAALHRWAGIILSEAAEGPLEIR